MLIIGATWIWTWHNSLQETGTTTSNGRGVYRFVHHPVRNQREWIGSAVDPCHGRRRGRRRHDGYEPRQANLRARDDLRQAVGEHHQQGRGSHHSPMRLQGQQPGQFCAREPAKLLLRLPPKHLGEHLVLVQLHMARAHGARHRLEGPRILGRASVAMRLLRVGVKAWRILPSASRAGAHVGPRLAVSPSSFGLQFLSHSWNSRNLALKHGSLPSAGGNGLKHDCLGWLEWKPWRVKP